MELKTEPNQEGNCKFTKNDEETFADAQFRRNPANTKGGDGGKGGDALESENSADGWGHGGDAGHGGNGFIAGNGGNGGKGGFSYGEGHFADTRGQSGNGGNGGNGGNKILGITYVTHAESLLTDVSCGNGGDYGRRGDIDWNGVWGIEGYDGAPGLSGSIDDSYYNSFVTFLKVNDGSNSL